jgi:hypothetical protein
MSKKILRITMTCLSAVACLTSCGSTGSGGGETSKNSTPGATNVVSIPSPKGAESWTLHQTNDVTGQQVTYVTPDGVRVRMEGTGLNYLCKAPDWNLVIYNTQSKKYSETPFSKLQQQQQAMAGAVKSSKGEKDFERGKDGKVADLNATQYLSTTKFEDGTETVVESWFTTDLASPPSAAHIFAKGTSSARGGVPANSVLIRMISTNGDMKMVALDTVKSERGPVASSVFEMPAGYKKVENALLD